MSHDQAIDFLVMNAIANDYEDFQTITADVSKWAAEDDLTITPELILESLERLVVKGVARAYVLSPTPVHVELVRTLDPSLMQEGYYFMLTPESKQLLGDSS